MTVARITELSETTDGGHYVVVEFRHALGDPDPFLIEDFTFAPGTIRENERPRPVRNEHGQVRIGGEWVWPTVEVNGDLVDRPDLDTAETTAPANPPEEILDAIDYAVSSYVQSMLARPGRSGVRTLPSELVPSRRSAQEASPKLTVARQQALARGDHLPQPRAEIDARRRQRRDARRAGR